jgi:hypothetical protein
MYIYHIPRQKGGHMLPLLEGWTDQQQWLFHVCSQLLPATFQLGPLDSLTQ